MEWNGEGPRTRRCVIIEGKNIPLAIGETESVMMLALRVMMTTPY